MISIIASGLLTATLSIMGKLVTQSFFEAVLTRVIIWSGERLAPMSTNSLDDDIVAEIKKRLQ